MGHCSILDGVGFVIARTWATEPGTSRQANSSGCTPHSTLTSTHTLETIPRVPDRSLGRMRNSDRGAPQPWAACFLGSPGIALHGKDGQRAELQIQRRDDSGPLLLDTVITFLKSPSEFIPPCPILGICSRRLHSLTLCMGKPGLSEMCLTYVSSCVKSTIRTRVTYFAMMGKYKDITNAEFHNHLKPHYSTLAKCWPFWQSNSYSFYLS